MNTVYLIADETLLKLLGSPVFIAFSAVVSLLSLGIIIYILKSLIKENNKHDKKGRK